VALVAQCAVSARRRRVTDGTYVVASWIACGGLAGLALYKHAWASGAFTVAFSLIVTWGWWKHRRDERFWALKTCATTGSLNPNNGDFFYHHLLGGTVTIIGEPEERTTDQ
jgi:hypothetical protein